MQFQAPPSFHIQYPHTALQIADVYAAANIAQQRYTSQVHSNQWKKYKSLISWFNIISADDLLHSERPFLISLISRWPVFFTSYRTFGHTLCVRVRRSCLFRSLLPVPLVDHEIFRHLAILQPFHLTKLKWSMRPREQSCQHTNTHAFTKGTPRTIVGNRMNN